MSVWLVVLVLVMGIVMMANPELVFKIDHFFLVKDGEPTEFYITKTRLLGVVLFLISFLILVWVGLSHIDFYSFLGR